jgi:2-keto-4-pentenoate hydratase/2-oxohepta-3-ene-1,7-dioic acid hydratase in catechol pathway
MRWARILHEGEPRFGVVDDDGVELVHGTPFGNYGRGGVRVPFAQVIWLPPVVPANFYCVGLNYAEHVLMAAKLRGTEPVLPKKPDVGYRSANALTGHEQPIVLPTDATERIEYEGELVCVIGRRAKHLTRANALDCLLGYTIGNDVSERTWQRGDRTFWRGKNTDTFKPMGPWMVTGLNPDDLQVTIRLNGKEMFSYAVKDAIFGVRQFISRMSQYLTLYPGDVLWMGTDGATENMKDGDVVEVEIPGIGVLRNPVVRER